MKEKFPHPDQSIIECLDTEYGIKVTDLTFFTLGADINASLYKAKSRDKKPYFVKVKRGENHDMGVCIVELLHDNGIKQVIPPVKTICGQLMAYIEDFTVIVFPFIDGGNGFSQNLIDNQWVSLGKTLRQVHEIILPLLIQDQVRKEDYSPKWREAIRSLYIDIEASLSDDPFALKFSQFMKDNISTIRRLVDRAEQLGQKLQNESHPFVLCHSDIHGGNVLIGRNESIFIVDWDDPIMAPKERDLMFIGGGVANVWNKPHEEKLFYEGYGSTEINSTILAYYRHERIVQDIVEFGDALLLTTTLNNEERSEMYKHFIGMFEPNGVVDIAFKTVEN